MQQLAWDYYVGLTTVHCIIKETCAAIWDVLSPIYLPTPAENWEIIADGFHKKWNMPLCLGALDGKHVQIEATKHSGSDYLSYKKSFSLVLTGVCNAYYQFTLVDIWGYGSNHDSSIFRSSNFGKAILEEGFSFPKDTKLPGQNQPIPYYFVGDQAFPLVRRIMRSYPRDNLNDAKKIFNYILSRSRRTIENTFGLAARWRILRRAIMADIENCEKMVQAVVCLHNFLQKSEMDIPLQERKYCPTGYVHSVDEDGNYHFGDWREGNCQIQSIGRLGSNNSKKAVQENREILKNYFTSAEGSLQWQEAMINRGALPTNYN